MPASPGLGRVVVNTSTTGNTTLVAAVAGKNIELVKIAIVVSAATIIQFFDGTNAVTGPMSLAANQEYILDESYDGIPWFSAVTGALIINQSTTAQIGGVLVYTQQ